MSPKQRQTTSELCIIGGQLRSRKWRFPITPGLRPTPNRLRETLFNWLAPSITGSHCLDLFAGSGALSFEALSRGAAGATLIELQTTNIKFLRQAKQSLDLEHCEIIQTDALKWLQQPAQQRYDLVFLDPPFHQQMLGPILDALPSHLASGALIYLETERQSKTPEQITQGAVIKEKVVGDVRALLVSAE